MGFNSGFKGLITTVRSGAHLIICGIWVGYRLEKKGGPRPIWAVAIQKKKGYKCVCV